MATTQSKPKALGHDARPKLHLRAPHNRLIKKLDLDKIYITGPEYGGPALVANAYLEGTYSEVYPGVSQDVQNRLVPLTGSYADAMHG
jgi:xylulose-5-phosphate/fructose-6-phosphate phosphoketolase